MMTAVSRCVTSMVYNEETGRPALACMVHTTYAPCPHNGEPASPAPVHVDDSPTRVAAIEAARARVGGARPIVVHNGSFNLDDREHSTEESGCWCGPVTIPSG